MAYKQYFAKDGQFNSKKSRVIVFRDEMNLSGIFH